MVYGRVNPLENACADAVGKLDRNCAPGQDWGFCTFHPVDIHSVFHRGPLFFACLEGRRAYRPVRGRDGRQPGLASYRFPDLPHSTKNFFFAGSSGLQPRSVYNDDSSG